MEASLKKGFLESLQKEIDKVDAFFDDIAESTLAAKVVKGLALPSKFMMYKMMRSCIAVRKVEELWIYNDELFASF